MIITSLCDSYKAEILAGVHALDDEYRLALYDSEANLGRFTTAYTPEGEVRGEGYEPGGSILSGNKIRIIGGTACLSFGNQIWPRTTIVARGAMIYNATKGGRAVAIFDFGRNVETRNGRFSVEIPEKLTGIK